MTSTSTPKVGEYVVYDPTGRGLPDCMEVGRVVDVREAVNGEDENLPPVPCLIVRPNAMASLHAERATVAVTDWHVVLSPPRKEA